MIIIYKIWLLTARWAFPSFLFILFASLCQEAEFSIEENRHTVSESLYQRARKKNAGWGHAMQCFFNSGSLASYFVKKIRFPAHHLLLTNPHFPLTLCLSTRYSVVFNFVWKFPRSQNWADWPINLWLPTFCHLKSPNQMNLPFSSVLSSHILQDFPQIIGSSLENSLIRLCINFSTQLIWELLTYLNTYLSCSFAYLSLRYYPFIMDTVTDNFLQLYIIVK